MDEEEFRVVSVIAARKAEFYVAVRGNLIPSLIPLVNKKDARLRLRKVISELDNSLFISQQEKDSRMVQPGLTIRKLNLDKKEIARRIIAAMSR